jgi:hypothetical protein
MKRKIVMRDRLGKELIVGDRVVHASRHASTLNMDLATIVEVAELHAKIRKDGRDRDSVVTTPYYLVKV